MQISLTIPLRLVVYPASDVAGVWVSHSLDYDVVTQGRSQQDAVDMLEAAINELVEFRTLHGLPPLVPRPAPGEIWDLVELKLGIKLSREPAPMWISAGKSDAPPVAETSGTGMSLTTYLSDRSPAVHASAV